MSVLYSLRGAGYSYGRSRVLGEVTMDWSAGEWVAILGPNGSGKSTLLSICAGLRPGYEGSCTYRNREVGQWPRRAFAREVAFVPQNLLVEFPFSATQVVLMGRTPFGDGMFESAEDFEAARRAMELTDCGAFRDRDFRALSGGERQRVILAAALAQSPKVLLLDEPAAFLDLKHQLRTHALLDDARRAGAVVVTVTHDLNHAATHADRVLLLNAGRVHGFGPPGEVLTTANIREVFGVRAELLPRPSGGNWIAYGG